MIFKTKLLFVFLAIVAAASAAAPAASVNVETFGAIADGYTDNTRAIQSAVASLHSGQTLYFPCTAGSYYNVISPIHFGALKYMHLEGGGPGCMLNYRGVSAQPYAFSFVGSFMVDIRNIVFNSGNTVPPQVVVMLGRVASWAAGGNLKFNGVTVQGFASKSLVYSIASEENTWLETSLYLNGGGALYAFYTSTSDDLGIANLPSASNLSLWMQNFHAADFSPSVDPTHALIFDKGYSVAAGNHTYRDGYMGSSNGTAFAFSTNDANDLAWMSLTVDSNRFENGYQMFHFIGGGSFGDVWLTNNKSSNTSKYLISLPTTCYNCTFQGNAVQQGDPTTSVFGILQNSFLSERHPFTIQSNVNSAVFDRSRGTMQLSTQDSTQACTSTNEGAFRYVSGTASADGMFQVCQRKSGSFSWVTH